jgi:DNA-binding GntR family transcriptional regulator
MARFKIEKGFQTKEEFLYETLREAILSCQLAPGEKLVVDRLSEEFGVSPIPVRTALQRLEVEGLVKIVPFAGALVAEITQDEIEEIFTVLEALERCAFAAAAQKISDGIVQKEELLALREIFMQMEAVSQAHQDATWSELNARFHLKIAGLTGMKLLIEFTRLAFDRWSRLRRYYFPTGRYAASSKAQEEHAFILALLEEGKADALGELAAAHNRSALLFYRQIVPPSTVDRLE